jgi:DNA-binding transcriptional LysR family regulator
MKSFSKAAAEKFMTQSAMSHLIRSLEQEVGVRLLLRDSRSVTPTAAGRLFYAHAREILGHYRKIDEDICALTTQTRGDLHIVSTRTIADCLLPEVLFSFRQSYPEISLTVSIEKTERVIQHVAEGTVDIGFFEGMVKDIPAYAEKITSDEIVLIASDNNALAGAQQITAAEICREPFILPEAGSGLRESVDAYLRSIGVGPEKMKIAMTSGDPALVVKMVQAGLGIALVSKRSALRALQDGSVVQLAAGRKKLTRSFYLAMRPEAPLLPRTFRKFIRQYRFFAA